MKKIYTITFHKANNYGAVLQAYALQKVLNKKYNSTILDYDNKNISNGYKLFKKNKGNIKDRIIQLIKDVCNLKKDYFRNKNFDKFRKEILLLEKNEDLEKLTDNDVCITGSDQVWNPQLTGGIDDIYTLNIDGKFKKISYAASCGNIKNISNDSLEIIDNIDKIDNISVREKSFQDFLTNKINKKVDLVLDPSLLLTQNEWKEMIKEDRIIEEKYIFVYCGDEPDYFYDIVNKIAEKTGYLIVHFGRRDRKNKFSYRKKSCYEYGPKEFVNLINHAEFVVTASFHGTALSILLNKSMFIILNKNPDRLTTLLDMVQLNDRILKDANEVERLLNSSIDWNIVNERLNNERIKSINWLYSAIEKNNF